MLWRHFTVCILFEDALSIAKTWHKHYGSFYVTGECLCTAKRMVSDIFRDTFLPFHESNFNRFRLFLTFWGKINKIDPQNHSSVKLCDVYPFLVYTHHMMYIKPYLVLLHTDFKIFTFLLIGSIPLIKPPLTYTLIWKSKLATKTL